MVSVVISQPMYWPWCGFLAQMSLADVFIWLDDVQFSKGSFTNRVQLKSGDKPQWLTIALQGKGSFRRIADLHPVDPAWRASHRSKLVSAFAGYPFRDNALDLYDAGGNFDELFQALIASSQLLAEALGVLPPKTMMSSAIGTSGQKTDRVLELVKAVGGTHYITGHGAASYLQHDRFETEGIDVAYMDYRPVPWPQPHDPFSPFVSTLDLIASVGKDKAALHLNPKTLDWRQFMARRKEISNGTKPAAHR